MTATNSPGIPEKPADSRIPVKTSDELEFQRRNPHLYTTLTQQVNFDGTITTLEQVTAKLRETRNKIEENARIIAKAHGANPDYWWEDPDLKNASESVSMIDTDIKRVSLNFVENYKRMRERLLHHQTRRSRR